MAFCANCGAALSDRAGFCENCGKPAGTNQTAISTPQPTAASGAASSGLTSNVAAALAYVLGFITGILFLVLEPFNKDRFVRFHAMQSILYSAVCIVFSIAWGIVWGILFSMSSSLFFLVLPLRLLISLGFFVFWLFLMYQAYNQREYRIPILGDIAAKQAGPA